MATLRGTFLFLARRSRPFLCQRHRFLSMTAVASAWNQDWKPGPIPHTPEERAAAAKKYGLRPEDYNSFAESEIGDYPHLPIVSRKWKDPYEDYDFPLEKRNYRDPIHQTNEFIGMDYYAKSTQDKYTYGQIVLYFSIVFFGLAGAFVFLQRYQLFLPEMPKQYPFNQLYLEKGGDPEYEKEVKHYTFEAVQDSE